MLRQKDGKDKAKYDDDIRASISRLSTAVEALMTTQNAVLATMAGLEYKRRNIDAKRTLIDVDNSSDSRQSCNGEHSKHAGVD